MPRPPVIDNRPFPRIQFRKRIEGESEEDFLKFNDDFKTEVIGAIIFLSPFITLAVIGTGALLYKVLVLGGVSR